jgi:signal transduction histidine kinase
MAGLPGAFDRYDIPGLRRMLDRYRGMTRDGLRDNLARFLREVIPTAEEVGVRMAIHPDDPPRPLMGLPRIVSNADDLAFITGAVDSPANGVTLCSGSLGAGASNDVPAIARRFAERIHHESARMGRLVSELLELTRLQGAEPLPTPEPVSVDWVIAEVMDRTRTPAAAKNIEVRYTGVRGATVFGNDGQIATAVTNLVENAIAYSGEDTEVTLTVRQDDWVEIDVADQGIGIPPQDLDRIFERFYRADRARSRSTGGTGLGLAIVKHIATNHGGRVDVTSTVGGGSTFTLRLPARPSEAPLPLPAAIEIESGAPGR